MYVHVFTMLTILYVTAEDSHEQCYVCVCVCVCVCVYMYMDCRASYVYMYKCVVQTVKFNTSLAPSTR